MGNVVAMEDVASASLPSAPEDLQKQLAAIAQKARPRLLAFVRRQVRDLSDVEDIVQDTLYELVRAAGLISPIEHLTGWLLRVARNRIIDRYRSKSREAAQGREPLTDIDVDAVLDQAAAPQADSPEAAYARALLLEELAAGLAALPEEQRAVFVAHELDGRSFKELAAASGESVNTLLGRKHAAVTYLRERLRAIRAEFDIE